MQVTELKLAIGKKIKSLREALHLSQEDLAKKMDWNSHVTVGSVERAERDLKAWELAKLSSIFRVPLHELLATEIAVEQKPAFVLWRSRPSEQVVKEQEARFFEVCRRFDFLEKALGLHEKRPATKNLPSFPLDLSKTTYSQVYDLANDCREVMGLRNFPAKQLVSKLEDEYEIRVVYLDLDDNQGSAACTISEFGKCMMLNRNEVPWRRNFSIAHELFHIITWNQLLFEQISSNKELLEKNEKLAETFAAGLLMPAEQIQQAIEECASDDKIGASDILAIAREFEVLAEALLWRLVNLKFIDSSAVEKIRIDRKFRELETELNSERKTKDHFCSWRFVRLAYQAHSKGRLSKANLAKYLDVSLVDLENKLADFGLAEIDGPEIKIHS
ncbi:MAG: ImmA/IrrE family metallo-endopeptidase [Deltaproteobacteria bacterium]|nr:ImmA/IrrE family metallo-endopeptidase [Deltaproteobacteria bacterium]